jgi:hypothetical protein
VQPDQFLLVAPLYQSKPSAFSLQPVIANRQSHYGAHTRKGVAHDCDGPPVPQALDVGNLPMPPTVLLRKLKLEEAFIDASFTGAKRLAVGPTRRGKGTKIVAIADDHSLPLAISVETASPQESQLVEGVLGQSFLDTLRARLIGDKAYDSDRLDRDLADRYGIEMTGLIAGSVANLLRMAALCSSTAKTLCVHSLLSGHHTKSRGEGRRQRA